MDNKTFLIAKSNFMLNPERAMAQAFQKMLEMRLKPKGDLFRYSGPIHLPKKLS